MKRALALLTGLLAACTLHAELLEDVRFSTGGPPAQAPANAGVVTLEIPRVATAPVLDGELTDACWQDKQACLGPFRLGLASTLARHTREAWACYDEQNLYFGVKLQRKPGQDLRVFTKGNDDGKIWEDDEIEMFFDPFGTGTEYFQLIINSGGFLFDATHRYVTVLDPAGAQPTDTKRINEMDLAWASGLQRKVAVHDDYWSAELALPLAAIGLAGAPAGHNLRFNITSADWDTKEYTCLSPTSDWQDPVQFGTLVLGKPLVAVLDVDLGNVGFGNNQLSVKVKDLTGQAAKFALALTLTSDAGPVEKREAFDLPAGGERIVALAFDVAARKGSWTAEVRILDDKGRPVFAGRRSGGIPEPLLVRLGSQATFTGNAPVVVAAHLGLGTVSGRATALKAALLDAESRVVAEQALGPAQGADLSARLPLDDLKAGRYVLRLIASDGQQTIATAEAPLRVAASPFEKTK
ncbi:MAG: hypothetical protein A3K19_05630 [Lentisphaerae bacterium RIFOXYB12_FULL_65_16]|nr:MAG: hypothetical protein A3K18_23670 [Lentisphaerae bacterium RIFOXYA12_64_32]OGV94390.1 MAG: hypothetical protein A3K19_05630 [Lentisphaerae bacterium RIFOXYB12_FULL_65_16]